MGGMIKSLQGCRSCQKVRGTARDSRGKKRKVCKWCRREIVQEMLKSGK